MQHISPLKYHSTSVTMRAASRRRFHAALKVLRRKGVCWSESELLRRLAKTYLRHWIGRYLKSATARRYNLTIEGEKYVRMPWYVDQMLYAILWQRAIHSGESISRMFDFAIRHYLPRLMEEHLRSPLLSATLTPKTSQLPATQTKTTPGFCRSLRKSDLPGANVPRHQE